MIENSPNKPVRFFYELNDAIYFIECEEFQSGANEYSDENDLINFIFLCECLNTKYRVSCKKLPITFIIQALNYILCNINLNPFEQQKREFSENDKKCLESHLKNDLAEYLGNHKTDNFLCRAFLDLYYSYESTIRQNNDYNNSNSQVLSRGKSYEYVEETVDESIDLLLRNNPTFMQYFQNNGLLENTFAVDTHTEEEHLSSETTSINEVINKVDYDKGILGLSLPYKVGYHIKFKNQSNSKLSHAKLLS
ncbi:hypothetical protein RclHR1_09040006 [Rhizophagus clarus]|uniref:Uncharacterized protein n=1 Tax=Rhizophagus clarus TaxID=94130 RepID=A0A2Z6SPH5_9GLOM|nr:hypothetical protein RclHR1_09040006 [Rhizophagus clarus]